MSPIPIVTGAFMREVDRRTIEELGLPGLVLMENAARSVVEVIRDRWPRAERITVLAGAGNNGGDGFAVARALQCDGFEVDVRLLVAPESLKGDAARQWDIARRFRVPIRLVQTGRDLRELERSSLLVDAILGTGLSRPVSGIHRSAIRAVNRAERPILAIDIPSGLDGGKGRPPGEHVHADVTVALGALKWAHVLGEASTACGEVVLADIGIPDEAFDLASPRPYGARADLFDAEQLLLVIPARRRSAHKGNFGHLLLLAGGRGQAGAAILAARGALRAGVGLLTVAAPAGIVPILQGAVPEAMAIPLPEGRDGRLSPESGAEVGRALSGKSAVAAGPGLGTGEGAAEALRVLLRFEGPALLDADALNLLASGKVRKREAGRGPTVITPHPGEAARLLKLSGSPGVEIDRPGSALRLASVWNATTILKGDGSLVASPAGDLAWINSGNPGLATGGSGDVLGGVVGALLARGTTPFEAAAAGAYLHGLAGDAAASVHGEEGMTSADLPNAIATILRAHGR